MVGAEIGQAGGQQLGFGRGDQQVLRAIGGGALLVGGVELEHLVFVDLGQGCHAGQVHGLLDLDHFEVGFVGDRVQVDAVGFRGQNHLRQGQKFWHVVFGFLGQWQVPVVGRQTELFIALDGPADSAFAGVVGRQGQQPVAVEHVMQAVQVVQGSEGRGRDITTTVIGPGLAQVEVTTGRRNELPEPDRIGMGIRHRVVGAFDGWQQGQFQRHVALFQTLYDVMNIKAAALAGVFQEGRVAGKPQALLFNAGVDVLPVLQLETLAHALPYILRGQGAGLLAEPERVLGNAFGDFKAGPLGGLRRMIHGLAAREGGGHSHRDGFDQARQCV